MTKKLLSGAGGGGGSPTIVKDNIRSQDSIEFTLGVCEGPIAGLVSGPKSFYLGDTPLVSQNNENNFKSFELHVYHGDDNPTTVRNAFGGLSSNTQVGVSLAQNTPVTRVTPASLRNQIDRLEVRLVFNQLLRTTDKGDQLEAEAIFRIQFKTSAAPAWQSFGGDADYKVKVTANGYRVSGDDNYWPETRTFDSTKLTGNILTESGFTGVSAPVLTGSSASSYSAGGVTYDRQRVFTYGTMYLKTSTGEYRFVPNTTAVAGISSVASQSIGFTADQQNGTVTITWKADITAPGVIKFKGKTGSSYVKEYVRRVDRVDDDYEIRVEKLTDDSDENLFVNMTWESFQCITIENKKYPNLAVIRGLGVSTNQFSSIPQFSGIYAGKLVKMPTNYNPVTRVYSGSWDGTFKVGYTDNPAWCLYDMIMDEKYGFKKHWPGILADRYSFYEAAQWCDELVPRPAGGYQPRYTYHDLLAEPRNGLDAAQYVASTFGAIITTDLNGTVRLKVDKPGSPVQIFGPESVTGEGFQYQFSEVASRANDYLVTFINPDLDWNQDVRQVFDQALIDRNGRIPMDFVAVGCIDVYEAQRRAYLRLLSANTEITTVTFSTARAGMLLEPFDIIGLVDPHMNWGVSGRIKSFGSSERLNLATNKSGDLNRGSTIASITPMGYFSRIESNGGTIGVGTNPNGARVVLSTDLTSSLLGKTVRVKVQARKAGSNPATRLRGNYATRTSGVSSGYKYFTLDDDWQWFQFTYTVPNDGVVDQDIVSFWPDQGGTVTAGTMDIAQVVLEEVDTVIRLRDSVYLPQSENLTMQVQGKTGLTTLTVQNTKGPMTDELVIVSGSLPSTLPEFAQFSLASNSVGLVKPFRILSISENEQNKDLYTISAIEINVNKYGDADNMTSSGTVSYAFRNTLFPSAPVNVQADSGSSHLYVNADGKVVSRIYVTWEQDPRSFVEEFEVFYRRLDRDAFTRLTVTDMDCYIENVQDGQVYEIFVRAVNAFNRRSVNSATIQHTVIGKRQPPADVQNAIVSQQGPDVRIDFDPVDDLDLDFYEIRVGTNWNTATKIGTTKTDLFIHTNVKAAVLNYLIKARDTTGNYSVNALPVSHTVPTPQVPTISAGFSGANYIVNIQPDPTDPVPVKEYVVSLNGSEVFRGAASSYSARVNWAGDRTVSVKVINQAGQESAEVSTTLTVNAPGSTDATGLIAETSYVLNWLAAPGSLPIDHYVVRNKTGNVIIDDDLKATTFTGAINWLGTRQFEVWAVDTAGNKGPVTTVSIVIVAPSVQNLQSTLLRSTLTLNWTGVRGSLPLKQYFIYLGNTFSTAQLIATVDAQTYSRPVDWNGSRKFWVVAEDVLGNRSTQISVTEVVDPPPAPAVTWSIVDNSIRLDWLEPTSELRVSEYQIYRDGSLVQKVSATTALVPIDFSGLKTYQVRAVDEAGNLGAFGTITVTIVAPTRFDFSSQILGQDVKFSWTTPTGSLPIKDYLITRGAANELVTRISGNSYSMKVNWGGSETFQVIAIDTAGNQSLPETTTLDVVAPSAPVVKPEVLDNNILLRWTNGTGTLPVVSTEIRRGADYATAEVLQQVDATFAAFFEFQAGNYTYWTVNIDSAGNYGSPVSRVVTMSEPPDFVLQVDYNSTLNGSRTRVVLRENKLFFGLSTTETWEQHFTTNSFTTPQDQITAGLPYYLQPTSTAASTYIETFDYGALLSSSVITVTPTIEVVAGDPTIQIDIEYRATTTDAWTKVTNVNQAYAQNFRYVRFTLRHVSNSTDDLLVVSAINLRLNTKIKNDAGKGTAIATDPTGTAVTFNTSFVDIQSITVTANTTSPVIAIYDFEDVPYPTGFDVYLFDKNGNRVTADFSWSARGF